MKSRLLTDGPPQVWAVVFSTGDTFPSGLADWAELEHVGAGTARPSGGMSGRRECARRSR
jgi:hypothetical protein